MQARSPPWTMPGNPATPLFLLRRWKGTNFTMWLQELDGLVPTRNCVLAWGLYGTSSFRVKDHPKGPSAANHQPPPTANCYQPPTANHRQLPSPTNRQPRTTTNHHQPPMCTHQPPPTTTNHHQLPPTANRQPRTANRPPPTHGVRTGFFGKSGHKRGIAWPILAPCKQ